VLEATQAVIYAPNETLNQKMTALQIISYSKSPTSTGSLRTALSHPEELIRLEAATALVERNDSSGLSLIVDALMQEPSRIPDGMRQSLAANIGTWLTDPKAAPDLVKLLKSPSAEIRRAATEGLWRTDSQVAVVPLLTMLGDSDSKVRYFSVVGLAEITGQLEWRPNPDDFAASSTKYVNHWSEWGATYGPQKQEPNSTK
jgi:HEAT repeat protein